MNTNAYHLTITVCNVGFTLKYLSHTSHTCQSLTVHCRHCKNSVVEYVNPLKNEISLCLKTDSILRNEHRVFSLKGKLS